MEGAVDVIIIGTGLTESITAAALSKAGYKIAHIDINSYYGADEASLSLDELSKWADERSSSSNIEDIHPYIRSQRAKFTSVTRHGPILPQSRQFAISLAPSLIPSIGPVISSLVSSGVARYGGYRLLESVGVYDSSGIVKPVPGSKEDVFKNKDISLVDKRRLMRFLMFASGDFEDKKELEGKADMPFLEYLKTTFSLNEEIATVITYSLAYCIDASDRTLPALLRIRKYIRSTGRYGASSFLVGHYGGTGEIAQGFCRTAAVSGGIYVLGRSISSIKTPATSPSDGSPTPNYEVELEDVPDKLTCNLIIASPGVVPHLQSTAKHVPRADLSTSTQEYSSIARCIAIIDRPISFSASASPSESSGESPEHEAAASTPSEIDTAVLVFPPSSLPTGSATTAVHTFFTGEGSMSTPSGKTLGILYLSMPLNGSTSSASPESLLKPYLDAMLALTTGPSLSTPTEPLFTTYYIQNLSSLQPPSTEPPSESLPTRPAGRPSTVLITPTPSTLLPESADSATTNAEAVFWEAVKTLKSLSPSADTREEDIETFWPPVEADPDEVVEDW